MLILTFKSILMQPFSTFNLSFCNLATVLATFPKIGQFFQISGHSVGDLQGILDQQLRPNRIHLKNIIIIFNNII
jgi:hypothetical protein